MNTLIHVHVDTLHLSLKADSNVHKVSIVPVEPWYTITILTRTYRDLKNTNTRFCFLLPLLNNFGCNKTSYQTEFTLSF